MHNYTIFALNVTPACEYYVLVNFLICYFTVAPANVRVMTAEKKLTFLWDPVPVMNCPSLSYMADLTRGCGDCQQLLSDYMVNCSIITDETTFCNFSVLSDICGNLTRSEVLTVPINSIKGSSGGKY